MEREEKTEKGSNAVKLPAEYKSRHLFSVVRLVNFSIRKYKLHSNKML